VSRIFYNNKKQAIVFTTACNKNPKNLSNIAVKNKNIPNNRAINFDMENIIK